MSNRKFWRTKEGYKIRIRDLRDDHLLNILNFLRKMKHVQDCNMDNMVNWFGEDSLAYAYAERAAEEMFDEDVEDRFPIYADLAQEAMRRKLLQGVFR